MPSPNGPPRLLIYAVVLASLGLRLINLNAPVIGMHSWRQSDTAGVARNYFERGCSFAYPEIDWCGDGSPRVETEFPAYEYAIAMVYHIVGEHNWVGRLISALAGAATVLMLYRLVRLLIDERTAFWSAVFYAFLPLTVFYSRTIQPESAMLMFSCAGVWAMAQWSRGGGLGALAVSWACITMACLLKLPALYLGLPLLVLCWQRLGARCLIWPWLLAYVALLLACVGWWYWHAHRVGVESGNNFQVLAPELLPWETLKDPQFYNIIVFRRLAERHFTWVGSIILLAGLLMRRRTVGERFFDWWLAAVIVYFFIAAFKNRVHEYYQLPFMLPGVVFMGKVYARLLPRWRPVLGVLLVGTMAFSAYRIVEYLRLENISRSAEWEAAQALHSATNPKDRVIVVDGLLFTNPTVLYLAHRTGWTPAPTTLSMERLDELASRGAVCIAGSKLTFAAPEWRDWLARVQVRFTPAYDTDRAFVVRLVPRTISGE